MRKVLITLQILISIVTVILVVLYLFRIENIQLVYCVIGAVLSMILSFVRIGTNKKTERNK